MKILITGGNGYLAKSIFRGLNQIHNVTAVTRNHFDLVDSRATNAWFDSHQYDAVIHTAITGGSRLVKDRDDVLDNNLRMNYNLLQNKDKFRKLITFGSGAEIYNPHTPYGLSKSIAAKTINRTENWYNLRIFGVFDEHELDTRFIKSNLIRYINKKPMIVHSCKFMDFFYMEDLISLVKYYLISDNISKEIDCCYQEKMNLTNVAAIINSADKYRVPVEILSQNQDLYCSEKRTQLPVETIGIRRAITEIYQKMKNCY